MFISSLTPILHYHTISSTDFHSSPAPHLKIFEVFLIYFPKFPSFSTTKIFVTNVVFQYFLLHAQFCGEKESSFLNAAFAIEILALIPHVLLALFVVGKKEITEIFHTVQLLLIYHVC
jgi:hypothetical protein